ncbi:MAG: SbcC/MukB-like Walker B domain-containing protein, partial [Desulfomonilaceae bacterium]|nr:SbcC/MukB-like Walker B domain-containing protein [Desulfomonilaceae bacterium]
PEEFMDLATLKGARQKAETRVKKLEEALEKARQDLVHAAEKLASCEAATAAAEDSSAKAGQRVLIQRQEFEQSIREAGFRDVADFASSKRTSAEIERLQKEIDEFDHSLTSAGDRVARAKEAVEGLTPPDLDALESEAQRIKNLLDKARGDEARLAARIDRTDGLLKDYSASSDEMQALEAKYGIYGRIAEVASGNNPQGIAFQRFVLAALLDDVLLAASKRLQIMSNRRYALQRRADRSDRRTAGGLDLEVSDSYTGTFRPVSTLSGGESFLASLSLALGLSDVVQAYAGGIHLDTIFVDEGFGSLDPEALDLAFRALVDLQRDGRLVGVISHVPDLRERVDTRLEVTANRFGSKAEFVF